MKKIPDIIRHIILPPGAIPADDYLKITPTTNMYREWIGKVAIKKGPKINKEKT